jgi:hypothetical protein
MINPIGDHRTLHCNMTQGHLAFQTSLDKMTATDQMTVVSRI